MSAETLTRQYVEERVVTRETFGNAFGEQLQSTTILQPEITGLLKNYDVVAEAGNIAAQADIVGERKEVRHEQKWNAFGQILLVREMDGPNGGKVKKIAGIDIAYPFGVDPMMGETILRQTLGEQKKSLAVWDGVKEGKLLALSKSLPDGEIDLGVIDRFVAASDVQIEQGTDKQSSSVQHYFDFAEKRTNFVPHVKKDAEKVLGTNTFLEKSAFNPDYKGKSIIFLEYYVDEKGELWGVDPKGKPSLVEKVAADQPHRQWLSWLANEVRKPGNRIIGHFEDTETVIDCRGSKGCSEFFDMMEGTDNAGLGKTIFASGPTYHQMTVHPAFFNTEDQGKNFCRKHNKSKLFCDCNTSEVLAAA